MTYRNKLDELYTLRLREKKIESCSRKNQKNKASDNDAAYLGSTVSR